MTDCSRDRHPGRSVSQHGFTVLPKAETGIGKATEADVVRVKEIENNYPLNDTPQEIRWGELHRAGYHYGITHLHHFYTARNYIVMSKLWKLTDTYRCKDMLMP